MKNAQSRSKWLDSFALFLCLGTIPRTLFAFRIFTLSVKIIFFLLSPPILFLCVRRVNLNHLKNFAPLSFMGN